MKVVPSISLPLEKEETLGTIVLLNALLNDFRVPCRNFELLGTVTSPFVNNTTIAQ